MKLPDTIDNETQLDDVLTTPSESLCSALGGVDGDLLILGAGGKMGPTLARLARRAFDAIGGRRRDITCVSRFSDASVQRALEECGVRTVSTDLLRPDGLGHLPEAAHILYLVGRKFGASDNQPLTWATNTFLPGLVMMRYPSARIVILSTGNVYPLSDVTTTGPDEDHPTDPIGEYAQSCLGRERVAQFWSLQNATPAAIVRLNYAVDLRYGVLLDIARRVYHRAPIDLRMGYVNVLWQGDANTAILALLGHASVPPLVLNVTGAEVLSVRAAAQRFGEEFDIPPHFAHHEEDTALLSNARRFHELLPFPKVPVDTMIHWTAHWVRNQGPTWNKPTHYQEREGAF